MNKKENLYVDIHVIQTVPPSCVNRDDTGAPKQCVFGGVRRARVSSQSWKRAVRLAFREMYASEDLAIRTKNIVGMVAEKINEIDSKADASALAVKVLESAGLKIKNDPKKESIEGTGALFFISEAQAKALAKVEVGNPGNCTEDAVIGMVVEHIKELDKTVDALALAKKAIKEAGFEKNNKKIEAFFFLGEEEAVALATTIINNSAKNDKAIKEDLKAIKKVCESSLKKYKEACKEALKEYPSIDLALFGRMVADEPSLRYDAAAMVAHAISTHKVQTEFDYFTAVDDLSPEDNSGAGHLGTVEFNSSTLYRYASVNVKELEGSLGSDTPRGVQSFVEAFLLSMPTGKITTFANRSIPNAVYVTIRTDQPVNMAAAFEKPVRIDEEGGYIEGSLEKLISYAKDTYTVFVEEPEKCWTIGKGMETLGDPVSLKTMLAEIDSYLVTRLVGEK